MKLSEAILKGCEEAGQAFHTFIDKKGRTCALGAAYQATFNESPMKRYPTGSLSSIMARLSNAYPELKTQVTINSKISKGLPPLVTSLLVKYSDCGWTLEEIIIKLNDRARVTREEIAAMLERAGY
jgi:hypothetical protein